MTNHPRIDTHHEVLPPSYSAWITVNGATPGGRPVPDWSDESALGMMAINDTQIGMLSISTPGIFFKGHAEGRPKARQAASVTHFTQMLDGLPCLQISGMQSTAGMPKCCFHILHKSTPEKVLAISRCLIGT